MSRTGEVLQVEEPFKALGQGGLPVLLRNYQETHVVAASQDNALSLLTCSILKNGGETVDALFWG